jgi:hypothetical protein
MINARSKRLSWGPSLHLTLAPCHSERSEESQYLLLRLFVLLFVIPQGSAFAVAVVF